MLSPLGCVLDPTSCHLLKGPQQCFHSLSFANFPPSCCLLPSSRMPQFHVSCFTGTLTVFFPLPHHLPDFLLRESMRIVSLNFHTSLPAAIPLAIIVLTDSKYQIIVDQERLSLFFNSALSSLIVFSIHGKSWNI